MRFILGSLLLLLLVSSLSPVHGILEAFYTSFKCRCTQTISKLPSHFPMERLEIRHPGNGCPNKEVIVWLKNKTGICLNPESKWTQSFVRRARRLKARSRS